MKCHFFPSKIKIKMKCHFLEAFQASRMCIKQNRSLIYLRILIHMRKLVIYTIKKIKENKNES